ncbi:serine aminopeptidase domain-containing protein [Yoonia sp. BS5-3]|uniref:Alpha/beta hydrolase n=1 Tax=Yoonia phaeophyticola TaxID=3137369 RepID=A0ABZ2UYY2_9RHOB
MHDITTVAAALDAAEAQLPNLRPGCQKQIVWANRPAARTPVALVYVHGFSAAPAETRPLPDLIAKSLGANIFFTRLTGHGQDGAAMAEARFADWQRDMAEAISIGQLLGEELILMGCSTGCTLSTLALAGGVQAKAMIHISPNFGLRSRLAQFMLDLPGAPYWGHLVAGRTRSFAPISDAHAANWTTQYPTKAVHPMAEAVRAVRKADLSVIQTPAYFAYNEDDQVVDAVQTRKVIARWGAPYLVDLLMQGPDDDASGHVMAGDVFSPKQTAPLAGRISDWVAML